MKLSIIIPVFNTEKYLENCFESILRQSETDFEVILVDDGSTDSSSAICDSYVRKYSFVHALHIPNSGPATAKNRGFKMAKGEYISFIDSDDELRPEMYSTLLESAYRNQADIVCCSYLQVDERGHKSHEEATQKEYILNQEEGLKHLLQKNMIYSQCWTKIYRKELLNTNQICFIDGLKTEEDFIYNIQVFDKSKIICIVDKPLYIYTHRETSLSREYYKSHLEEFLKNMTFRLELTDRLIQKNHPPLVEVCTVHCLSYYNLMLGRAAMFKLNESQPYFHKGLSYIKRKSTTLLKYHFKCGLSLIGAFLCKVLSEQLYYKYRHLKYKK